MVSIPTKMSVKGQIVIPQQFREEFKLRAGETLLIKEEKGRLLIEKPKKPFKQFMADMRRKYAKPGRPYTSSEYERAMERGEC